MIISRLQVGVFAIASLLALMAFGWPLWVPATTALSDSSAGALAIVAIFALAAAVLWVFDRTQLGPRQLALLGALSALASATRIATAGVAGFELVFLFVILGAVALGARFGFLLGALTIVVSSLFFGGFGPWTAFQIFAVGWVGLGAGLIGRLQLGRRLKIGLVATYAVLASYGFGLVMNLWFWPFAVGPESAISYRALAPLGENLASFLLYSLTSSTLSWDSVRAVTLAIAIIAIGNPVLRVLERAKL